MDMDSRTVLATRRRVITATRLHIAAFISAAAGAVDITTAMIMAATGMATGTAADTAMAAVMVATVDNGPVADMLAAAEGATAAVGIDKDAGQRKRLL
jgi:hypothetical protein